MKIKQIITLSFGFVLLTGFAIYGSYSAKQIVYIDLQEVFTNFDLKKEIDTDLKNELVRRDQLLDSLKTSILFYESKSSNSSETHEIARLKSEYIGLSKKFAKQNQEKAKELTDMVWVKINFYLEEYSENRNIDFVLGLQGSGNVMYAKKELSVTDDFISYLNEKYHDK